ncbi:MAG: putative aldouronate transport system substrate-binding protein [Candidatus Promineifilaceae bacterium]|jgi:putative aldouronate transport system substrate-binding protein
MTGKEKLFLGAVATVAVLVLSLIPSNPKSRLRIGQPSPVEWSAVQDDESQTLGLRWQGMISYQGAKEGSWLERNLEQRFNVEISPVFMDATAYNNRRPLMLCGGDIPDVMWTGDPTQVRANLRNGFVMELPYELILEHCPTYVKWVNIYGKEAWLYGMYKGRNYGLPTVDAGANRPRISCWRLDWMKNVGIERVPETVSEMYEALYAFRHSDPDGNGVQDTYGWAPNISHWSLLFAEIFAAHGVLAFDLMERDGHVVWGGLLPETKEALRALQTWYAEGLLDPDFPLDTQGRQNEARFVNGKVGYLHALDHPHYYYEHEAGSMVSKTRAFTPTALLEPGPPLRDAQGRRRGRTWGGAAHVLQFGKHLEQQPEKVIRVLRMVEAIARDEALYMEVRYGKRGMHWEYAPEAFTRADGKALPAGINLLLPFDADDQGRQRGEEMLGLPCKFFFPSSLNQLYDQKYIAADDLAWLERNRNAEWGMMNVLGKSDVVPSAGRYLGDLINYQMTVFVEIVVGQRDVESFDEFVTEWRRRGGDVILEEANAMYAEMQTIYTRVGVGETP